jgi:hypothetical protein
MTDKKIEENIYTALFAVQTSVDVVKKTADNPFFKSKYADLPAVWDVVKDALAANNILVYHKTDTKDGVDYLNTFVRHVPSGTEITSNVQLHLQKPTSQEYGSCVTYMRRYAISSMLGLITDKDDDGNDASQPKAKTAPKVEQKPVKKEMTPQEQETASKLTTIKDAILKAQSVKMVDLIWNNHADFLAEIKQKSPNTYTKIDQIYLETRAKLDENEIPTTFPNQPVIMAG